ncbi:MAG TPA: M91 family zinc metallopeptidase [Thermoanaerobaculia bacterium]|nr:M91 family zinc metallopeptidase [Thermoanaerobaculia bacterium]
MAQTIEYWRPATATYHAAGPGIKVVTDEDPYIVTNPRTGRSSFGTFPAGFRAAVADNLSYLNRTTDGNIVLTLLAANSAAGIGPGRIGNAAKADNADPSLNAVAAELIGVGHPGAQTLAAIRRAIGGGGAAVAAEGRWLAHVINASPRWTLDQVPGQAGGFWSSLQGWRDWGTRLWLWNDTNVGYFNSQLWLSRWGTGGQDIGVTPAAMNAWLNGAALPARFAGGANYEHIVISTLVALAPHAADGTGSSSDISWHFEPGYQPNTLRPPAIGLGHELIHAYYSWRGQQLGRDRDHFSTVLFEYRCVGLGPWDEVGPSENTLRRQWGMAVPHIPPLDAQNRMVPPKRIRY